MTSFIFSSIFNEASAVLSPQKCERDVAAPGGRYSCEPSPLSLIVALAAELEASEARARYAETQLAEHDRHCICRAAVVAAEVAELTWELADPHAVAVDFDMLSLAA